jgi:hypothetical protein
MDAGGVRIFQHLERHLAGVDIPLRPHMMDIELLRRFGRPAPGVAGPVGDMHASAIAGLADLLAASGLVHEQEELDPRSPLTLTPAAAEPGKTSNAWVEEELRDRLGPPNDGASAKVPDKSQVAE